MLLSIRIPTFLWINAFQAVRHYHMEALDVEKFCGDVTLSKVSPANFILTLCKRMHLLWHVS
jgi:hypothetical protein